MTTALYISLLVGALLVGWVLGHRTGYWSFRKAFKDGVRDDMTQRSPEELRVFEEVLNEQYVALEINGHTAADARDPRDS
ncbi:unnamed protein product [marine sediment metagenome]|uniref:Uncharacterized protein n=1 Tax=marine sediment metagenome TaxID=412755 RepID=X0W569_9ZZZZ